MQAGNSEVKINITISEVHIHLESVDNVLVKKLSNLEARLGELIMATKEEVLASIAAEAAQVADAISVLETKILDLIAAQNGATPADLDEILSAIQAIYTPAVIEEPVG